jgi:hypothetical protein
MGGDEWGWIDDIKEWAGMSLCHMIDIVHDREQWKMVVNLRAE